MRNRKHVFACVILFLCVVIASHAQGQQRYRVAILLFEGVQIIDYTGPYEVLGAAGMEVFTVSQDGKLLNTNMDMKVTPTYSFETCPEFDILVLPGGGGYTPEHGGVGAASNIPAVLQWIQESAESAQHVMSVCNGAFFLAFAGLLDGQEATTYWGMIPDLDSLVPGADVVNHKRFTDNGKILTTAGLSAGIDGSLHLVEKLFSRGRAQMVALGMEYDWKPESTFARAALADRYMRFWFTDEGQSESLNREGTNVSWESKWRVWEISAEKLFASINESITTNHTWVSPHVQWQKTEKQSNKPFQSHWKFQDEKGDWWNGFVVLTHVDGKTDDNIMSISVSKR